LIFKEMQELDGCFEYAQRLCLKLCDITNVCTHGVHQVYVRLLVKQKL